MTAARLEKLLSQGTPILLIALSATLCSVRLAAKSLTHDEAFTLAVSSSDAETFWSSLVGGESFAGLYYSIIRLFPMFWDNEATLRAPSVVFGVLSTLSCYLMARGLFGFRVALISVLLLAVNLLFLRYVQEARSYALVLLLVTLATWLLIHAVRQPSWARWLGFGVIAAFAVYAHFFAVLVLVAHALSLLLHRSLVPWKKAAAAAALTALLVMPLAVVLWSDVGGRPKLAQTSIIVLLQELAGVVPTRLGWLQTSIYTICSAAAVIVFFRQRRERGDSFLRWRYTLLFCWVSVPIVLGGLLSLLWPVLVPRYFVVCLPGIVMLIAVGLAFVRPAVQLAGLLIILFVGAQGLHTYYGQDYKEGENWRALVRHVAQEAEPGDGIVFLSRFGRRPFEYYLSRHTGLASGLAPEYPAMPWGDYDPVVSEMQVDASPARVHELERGAPVRFWVVLLWGGFRTGDDDGAPFQRMLTRDYVESDYRFFGRYLKLALFERRGVTSGRSLDGRPAAQ